MTNSNFSNGFDILLNSYASEAKFGEDTSRGTITLDEYEKSVFLTKAQEEVILSLYTGRNSSLQSFEETEELRRYLSNLVKEYKATPIKNSTGILGVESSSKFFTLPPDLWFITYESATITKGNCATHTSQIVVPVTQDEYHKVRKNPFRGINNRRALRLDLSNGVVEIVSKYQITEYYVRYLRKLKPIILVDLKNDGLEINGETEPMESEVHEGLHQRILERAVELALTSRGVRTATSDRN